MSKNPHDWLGEGAYFWENNPDRALKWAEHVKKRPQSFKHKIKDVFVIGAIINRGNCLDLTDAESLEVVRLAYKTLADFYANLEMEMPTNEEGYPGDEDLVKRNLDCAVINAVHDLRAHVGMPLFDTVRGIFTEGNPLFPGSKIQEKTHVQICVREPEKSILGYFLPAGFQI